MGERFEGVVVDRFPTEVRREIRQEELEALLQGNRMRSLQFVTQAGMQAITGVTAYEQILAAEVPNAARRLKAVGDVATAAIASQIAGLLQ